MVKHSTFDAQHHGGVLVGVGGNSHRLVDDAGTVGPVGHLDDYNAP